MGSFSRWMEKKKTEHKNEIPYSGERERKFSQQYSFEENGGGIKWEKGGVEKQIDFDQGETVPHRESHESIWEVNTLPFSEEQLKRTFHQKIKKQKKKTKKTDTGAISRVGRLRSFFPHLQI